MPADLSPGPYKQALELANQAKFTQEELNTYERVRDEIRQVIEIAAERWAQGHTKGKVEGLAEGEIKGKRDALVRLLSRTGIVLPEADRARLQACTDTATLDRWIDNVFGAKTAADVFT